MMQLFTNKLMKWHKVNNSRKMPWKGEKDPYKVWLSEIILQQTRVSQGWSYYEKFTAAYPTIFSLANAADEDVFKLWEGLGYYSRCCNLLHTARTIVHFYNGVFPASYEQLLQLKGIGKYTASAIASFCFNLPYAVVDANVYRVLARVYGISASTDTMQGKETFAALANKLISKKHPGSYNQAVMDFGATICTPLFPQCSLCVMQKICTAYKTGRVNALPVKANLIKKRERWFSYFIFKAEDEMLIFKRSGKDIWQNLHEFYLVETKYNAAWDLPVVKQFLKEQFSAKALSIQIMPAKAQQLTHQLIKGWFITVNLASKPKVFTGNNFLWLSCSQLQKLAFPKFIHQYFKIEQG